MLNLFSETGWALIVLTNLSIEQFDERLATEVTKRTVVVVGRRAAFLYKVRTLLGDTVCELFQ